MVLVPNGLSCLRLAIAGIFYWLDSTERIVAAVAAAASDFLDGVIARRYGLTSVVGGLLDALGDKLFVLVALLTLGIEGVLAWWQLPLVLLRDLCVGGTVIYAVTTRTWGAFRHMPAHSLGKQATAAQFALILGGLIELRVGPLAARPRGGAERGRRDDLPDALRPAPACAPRAVRVSPVGVAVHEFGLDR